MHYDAGKKQISATLCVNADDVKELLEIDSRGIELEGRVLPSDERGNVTKILKEADFF
jgi:PTS system mannose-specific IIB component